MSKTVTVQLTTIGANTGPFNIYSNADLYESPVAVGVTAATIQTGINVTVPDSATIIRVMSTGACENNIFIVIQGSFVASCGIEQGLNWGVGSTTGSSALFSLGSGSANVANLLYEVVSGSAAFQVTYGGVTQVLTPITSGAGTASFNYIYNPAYTDTLEVTYASRANNLIDQYAWVSIACPTASTDITTTTTTVYTGSCLCPEGFTANPDSTECIQVIEVPPSVVSSQANLTTFTGDTNRAYGEVGYVIYNINDYDQAGNSISGLFATIGGQSGPFNSQGYNQNFLAGRLNAAGIWDANKYWPGTNDEPKGPAYPGTLGLCTTINVPTSKIYYVGIAGDNAANFKVNGSPIVNQVLLLDPVRGLAGVSANFKFWHIYPVYLVAGPNVIELQNSNAHNVGAFAAEIYNNTVNQLVTATQESDLNILFTTKDYRSGNTNQNSPFCTAFTCPTDYALDRTDPDNPVCKLVTRTACSPTPVPTTTTTTTTTTSTTTTTTTVPTAGCYLATFVVGQADVTAAQQNIVNFTYLPCGASGSVLVSYNQAGTYSTGLCWDTTEPTGSYIINASTGVQQAAVASYMWTGSAC